MLIVTSAFEVVRGYISWKEEYPFELSIYSCTFRVPKGVGVMVMYQISIVLDMKELCDSNSQNWDNWYLGFLIVVGYIAILMGMLAVKFQPFLKVSVWARGKILHFCIGKIPKQPLIWFF